MGSTADRFEERTSGSALAGNPVLDALAALCAIQFTRSYLRTPSQVPGLDRVLWALMGLGAVVLPISWFTSRELADGAVSVLAVVGPIMLLATGIICLRRGDRQARYFLLAFAALLIGIVIEVFAGYLSDLGGPILAWAEQSTYPGAILMLVLFSLGLTDRYNITVRENERVRAENQALEIFSYKDGLTGVWNRRRFDERLAHEWKRAARSDSVISPDLDRRGFSSRSTTTPPVTRRAMIACGGWLTAWTSW